MTGRDPDDAGEDGAADVEGKLAGVDELPAADGCEGVDVGKRGCVRGRTACGVPCTVDAQPTAATATTAMASTGSLALIGPPSTAPQP
jgi:hypothetical protein